MEEKKVWYLGERAEQLAIVYLSRRDDLMITRPTETEYGFDLIVSLTQAGNYTGRIFGVQVKAIRSHKQVRKASPAGQEFMIAHKPDRIPRDIPFPLCLFLFTMDDDAGFYKWIKKPGDGMDGTPPLALDDTATFRQLNNEALDQMIAEVNHWYEQRLKIPA